MNIVPLIALHVFAKFVAFTSSLVLKDMLKSFQFRVEELSENSRVDVEAQSGILDFQLPMYSWGDIRTMVQTYTDYAVLDLAFEALKSLIVFFVMIFIK